MDRGNMESGKMDSGLPAMRAPRWFWIPLRALAVTFLLTLLCFAGSLFLGIVGTVLTAELRGVRPDMRLAYRHFAAPVAVLAAIIALVWTATVELRRYRQAKALAQIERAER